MDYTRVNSTVFMILNSTRPRLIYTGQYHTTLDNTRLITKPMQIILDYIKRYIPEQTGHEYVIGFDTIEINLISLVASRMGLVIVLANLASEMKPSLDFFLFVKSDSEGI